MLAKTYKKFKKKIIKANNMYLFDEDNKEYLDFLSGIAVCSLGHSHPKIVDKISSQAKKLVHISNLFTFDEQENLADKLCQISFADQVFFTNSGTETMEAAIKLARKFFYDKGEKEKYKIISMENSFHGRSLGALSATGQKKLHQGFEPMLEGFSFAKFNDIESLKSKIDKNTAAIILELLQGEGGINLVSLEYLKEVKKICQENEILLIFDEIQTGIGRLGKFFAYQLFDIEPDIMALAKGLGSGMPIGALLAKKQVMQSFQTGDHGTTFGGNPFTTSVALEVLKIIEEEKILDNVSTQGQYFKDALFKLAKKYKIIEEVKGEGLLLGLKLSIKGADIVEAAFERGFIINCVQNNTLRFAPPLIVAQNHIDKLIDFLDEALAKL